MADKNNATCSICGNPYYVCLSCQDSMKLHPWKSFTDTAEHFKIFQVLRGFSTGVYTKDEAKERLCGINLDDLNSFRPHIKKVIKDILKEEKKFENKIEVVVEPEIEVKEDVVIEDVVEAEKSENIAEASYFRKKNYRTGKD